MLISKHNHNHNPGHIQLPGTSRSHPTHPSAFRHGLAPHGFSAEIMSKKYVLHWTTSSHLLYIFSDILVQKTKVINSSYFRKHSKRSRYWETCSKEDSSWISFFYKWGNEYTLHVRPAESTRIEYDLSCLRAGLKDFFFLCW